MPADAPVWLAWESGAGLVPGTPPAAELLVADSWLVQDGRSRFLQRHRARFTEACRAAGAPGALDLDGFWQRAVEALPREGEWFPRVELLGGRRPCAALRLRPAPARTSSVRLRSWRGRDPRRIPHRKGPDLDLLARLRAAAAEHGADDHLLLTGDGWVTETTSASLVWWEGADLCLPGEDLPVLPGVTAAWLADRARRLGVRVHRRRARPADLDGRETWVVNALHGIRPVTSWSGTSLRPGPARRAPSWQRAWQRAAHPLPGIPTAA
ncbi:aminotransferase class IV [Streptomyces sp. TRM S81-3]|uniref:Aminotransferase class IV n=1 Tax=Streptomyces griseicoloratus TaxID=2752516 RepID=A0A926L107_9ACTN|nr:aminotransferase class IV [Streptomyces griseicoloratus]MBD0420418.1 aminotransferase class IV [Streptomyces griseicoloratus]